MTPAERSSVLVLAGLAGAVPVFAFGGWVYWLVYMVPLLYGFGAGLYEGSIPKKQQKEEGD